MTADAFSRITINDLTKIYENNVTMLMTTSKPVTVHIDTLRTVFAENTNQMLAITRSMTRKNVNKNINENKNNEKRQLNIYQWLKSSMENI